jgi:lipopolysaccharide transport system ATP-binding protein
MSDIVISVENLSKQYRYGVLSHATLRKDFQSWWARIRGQEDPNVPLGFKPSPITHHPLPASDDANHFWALRDVSFEVKKGEVLGIIGKNGAGKSTLLKIMSRVTTPTKGQIKIKDRVASLLEVGTGFHPELTGQENIFLNGAILGMTKDEIKRKFNEIVVFAELGPFIDTPVKRYSSGMYVRLAFAVAAHLEPEILLIDEVLAVGDIQFQQKCLGKMNDVAKEGRTVLFVSHNMTAIQQLCSRVLWISGGTLKEDGTAGRVMNNYMNLERIDGTNSFVKVSISPSLEITSLVIKPSSIVSGSSIEINIGFRSLRSLKITDLCLLIYSVMGVRVGIVDMRAPDGPYRIEKNSSFTIKGLVDTVPLVEGRYRIGLFIDCGEARDNFFDLCAIDILPSIQPNGMSLYPPGTRGFVEMRYKSIKIMRKIYTTVHSAEKS